MTWAAAFTAAALLLAMSTIATVIRTHTALPKWDQWHEIFWLQKYYTGQWHVSDLWRQHNEHRILFPRIFLLTDWFLFRGTSAFVLFSMLLLQGAHAWIFIGEVSQWRDVSREIRLTTMAILVALFFSGAHLDNFTWPLQISFILVSYAGTISIYSLIRYGEISGGVEGQGWMWLAGCIAGGVVATYSLSNGILIWPVLLATGLMNRIRPRILLLVGIVFGITATAYFSHYQFVDQHTNVFDSLKRPVDLLYYASSYLAIPVSRIHHTAGAVVGLAAMLALAWEIFRHLRRRASRVMALSLGVMVYITAGAWATALGRLSLGLPDTALRYATPVCIFWACGLLVALEEARAAGPSPAGMAAALSAAITGLILTIVPLHLENIRSAMQIAQSARATELALRADVEAKDQIDPIFPDRTRLGFGMVDVLRAHHRSIFAGNAIAAGNPLGGDFHVVGRDRCQGRWEWTKALEGSGRPGDSAMGWAWDSGAGRPPKTVLFLDQSRVIRGLAEFTEAREDVAVVRHDRRMLSSGWFGFTRHAAGIRAYALLADGRSLCELGGATDGPRTLYGIFRRGQWTVDSDGSGNWETEDRSLTFGFDGDIPVAGDWDGSGVVRAGVFRKGEWYLDMNNNGRWDDGDRRVSFGLPGDLPVVGDWGQTGVTKLGVFRNGVWILDWKGERGPGPGNRQFRFGDPGDIPVAGDWDGSGVTRIGVFRRGLWFLDVDGDFQFDSRDKVVLFGIPGDQPVTGDWSGLGITKIGVFRSGEWLLDFNGNFGWDARDVSGSYGVAGDVAVVWGAR